MTARRGVSCSRSDVHPPRFFLEGPEAMKAADWLCTARMDDSRPIGSVQGPARQQRGVMHHSHIKAASRLESARGVSCLGAKSVHSDPGRFALDYSSLGSHMRRPNSTRASSEECGSSRCGDTAARVYDNHIVGVHTSSEGSECTIA